MRKLSQVDCIGGMTTSTVLDWRRTGAMLDKGVVRVQKKIVMIEKFRYMGLQG